MGIMPDAPSNEKVRIRSAADLFEVLTDGSLEAQIGVLQSVVQDPTRPLSLGKHEGEDFIDLLIRLFPQRGSGLSQLYLMCLSCYQDPRTTAFMVEEFSRSRDAAAVLHLGRRLSIERGADFFRDFLWQDKSAQALAAARLLLECEDLVEKERLRMALVLDVDFEPPAIRPVTLDLWVAELNGPHRARVKALAEQRGEEVLYFWERWSELSGDEREWLVNLTARLNPELARLRLRPLMEESTTSFPIVRQAMKLGMDLPSSAINSEHELVRALAVTEGLAGDRVLDYLAENNSIPEAVAATRHCTREKLLELLADARWQVRAAATEVLAGRDDCPVEEIRVKVGSEHLGERIAALDVLRRIGDDEWLEVYLESQPNQGRSIRTGIERSQTSGSF
jgi:hypothetical protein